MIVFKLSYVRMSIKMLYLCVNFTGPKGEKGDLGPIGPIGPQGPQGND